MFLPDTGRLWLFCALKFHDLNSPHESCGVFMLLVLCLMYSNSFFYSSLLFVRLLLIDWLSLHSITSLNNTWLSSLLDTIFAKYTMIWFLFQPWAKTSQPSWSKICYFENTFSTTRICRLYFHAFLWLRKTQWVPWKQTNLVYCCLLRYPGCFQVWTSHQDCLVELNSM